MGRKRRIKTKRGWESARKMAEGYDPVKKYERADGSAERTVEAALEGRGLDTPYKRYVCRGALQICEIRVVELLDGPAQIYGTIKLHHPHGVWILYNRDKNNAETIKKPGPIEVMLPTFCILPYDPVGITFHFGAGSGLEEMNEDSLSWMPDDPPEKVRLFRLGGEKSIMEVRLIAFTKADLADIEISLNYNNMDYAEEQEIHGTITALFRKKFEGLRSFPLFCKEDKNDFVCVKAGEPIPLLRSFIALPHGDGFDINVKLCTVSGVPVARGNISFRPNGFGNWVGVLGTKDGEIQVKANVAFSSDEDHQPTINDHIKCLASLGLKLIDGRFVHGGLGESTQSSVPASA